MSKPLPGMKGRHIGKIYLRSFVELGGLKPDDAVLEPGCGTGRMAEALADFLSPNGSYDGFDVMAEAIEWCQENLAPKHPNLRFRHVDVFNRAYNPKGRLHPAEFEFPYSGEAFDFALLTSVFTHMLPPDVEHYLGEIRRVLRPRAKCVVTFFVLSDDALARISSGRAQRRFGHEGDGFRYDVRRQPEAAVAYREDDVRTLVERAGLELDGPIHYGRWSGLDDRPLGQDILVVERPGETSGPEAGLTPD